MRIVVPALLLLAALPLSAAEPGVKAQSDAAFAELDRLVEQELGSLDAPAQKAAEQDLARGEQAQAAAVAKVAAAKPAAAPAPAAPKSDLVTAVAEDPEETIDAAIAAAGLQRGPNEDKGGAFISVATVPVLEAPGTPNYVASRALAYARAEMEARVQALRYIGVEIASGRTFEKAKDGELKRSESIEKGDIISAKVAALAEAKLDAELRALGVDPARFDAQAKRKTLDQTMHKRVATRAAGCLQGCAVFAVAEGQRLGKQHLSVAVIWSPNLQKLAGFLLGASPKDLPAPPAGKPLAEHIPADKAQLAARFGVKPVVDDKGERWLIAFGQGGVVPDADADILAENAKTAESEAEMAALAAIKEFAWEQTSNESESVIAESLQRFERADGSTETLKSTANALRERTVSGGNAIKLAGAKRLKRWDGVVDGCRVVGVIMAWSPATLKKAEQQAKDQAGAGGKRGGDAPAPGSW